VGALAALALAGCESTQEKSAQLEKAATRETGGRQPAQKALQVTKQSTLVTVLATKILTSREGTAAVVTLRNDSATALRDAPVEIAVESATGATVYTNAIPGLASTLVSVPLLPAHATTTWIDDQVQAARTPVSVTAKVGEGEAVRGAIPQMEIIGAHLSEGAAEGSVSNHSRVGQHELVIYALARRAGAIVAAGRAIVPQLEAGGTARFQAFLIGSAQGAQLEVSAPPSATG
jgi:hypothetical protein